MGQRYTRTVGGVAAAAMTATMAVGLSTGASAAPGDLVDINLLNINDFHGRIDDNTVQFAATVQELREAYGAENTLFLSAGDNIGASLFASATQGDAPTIELLNTLDLAASAVGNHEFDAGYDDLTGRVDDLADFAYLGANVYEAGTQTPALDEYATFEVAGMTVGVIGVVTQETPSLVSPGGIEGLDFGDPVEAVNRVAAQLSDGDDANGEADVIVAEFHEGAASGAGTLEEEVAEGGAFADIVLDTSAEVDAIFTGHTHMEYAWDAPIPGEEGTRPIVQTGSYGANIGQIVLTVDETGTVVDYLAQNVERLPAPESDFEDVPEGFQFEYEIDWAATVGLANGYADGGFHPAAPISRQAMAAFLYRLEHDGATAPACTTAPFPDVTVANEFCGAITWMVESGLTTGYADGTFRPTAAVSRQATAAFLYRLETGADVLPTCTAAPFPDVPTGNTFCAAIAWLVQSGITQGYADGTFRPTTAVSRQAMAAFLFRTAEPVVAQVKMQTAEALEYAEEVGSEVVAEVTADITTAFSGGSWTGPGGTYVGGTRDDRASASTLATLVANALRDVDVPSGAVADIGVTNPGGLRGELFVGEDGEITYAEANAVLPFVNNVWHTTLTGAQLVELLNQQWQRTSEGEVPSRPYLQLGLSDNVSYVADPTRPEGDRIIAVTVDGEPVDPAAEYRISTFSFLAQGGDNFHVFDDATNTVDTGLIDRDAWIQYLTESSPLSPDFAKRFAVVTGLDESELTMETGETVTFDVSGLDLTSLGSPANTSLSVMLGETAVGTFPVASGAASVSFTVPSGVSGEVLLTLMATPSGTTVAIPVEVGAPPV